jgi:hypothetical protein
MIANGPSRDVPLTHNYWEIGQFLQTKYNIHFTQLSADMLLYPNEEDLAAADPAVQVSEV